MSRGRTTPGKQETREERREERGKVEERRVGAMPADRSKSKGEETEKVRRERGLGTLKKRFLTLSH